MHRIQFVAKVMRSHVPTVNVHGGGRVNQRSEVGERGTCALRVMTDRLKKCSSVDMMYQDDFIHDPTGWFAVSAWIGSVCVGQLPIICEQRFEGRGVSY